MAYTIQSLTVDLMEDRASVNLADQENGSWVAINVKIATPGNQPENRLKKLAKDAARQALQEALNAL